MVLAPTDRSLFLLLKTELTGLNDALVLSQKEHHSFAFIILSSVGRLMLSFRAISDFVI